MIILTPFPLICPESRMINMMHVPLHFSGVRMLSLNPIRGRFPLYIAFSRTLLLSKALLVCTRSLHVSPDRRISGQTSSPLLPHTLYHYGR